MLAFTQMNTNKGRGMKIIYDFGSNNGNNIPYYLKKADRVIAVEANPSLTDKIKQRFQREIADEKLIVLNYVLTNQAATEDVAFYIHKIKDVLSQFPQPNPAEINNFEKILLPAARASEIIQTYGSPYYVKIDIEGYDQAILQDLFAANIRPEFISAESHNIDIFSLLFTCGNYKAFKLLDGFFVNKNYKNAVIQTVDGPQHYSFPAHSAGPFGEDILGSWMTANNFFYFLSKQQLGWKDIHATNTVEPDPTYQPTTTKDWIPPILFKQIRALKATLTNR
jgi:FkbM family methyltransferase